MIYIYTLSHPITKEIRYVGQTTNIIRRFKTHLSSSNRKNSDSYYTHKARWIRKILNEGLIPIVEIIDTCYSLVESNNKERYYIEKLTNEGLILTNSYSSDVTAVSDETRAKISKGLFSRHFSQACRKVCPKEGDYSRKELPRDPSSLRHSRVRPSPPYPRHRRPSEFQLRGYQ